MLGVIKLSGGDLASGPLAFSCSEGERGAVVTGRMRNSEQQQDGCKSEPNTSFFFFFFLGVFVCLGALTIKQEPGWGGKSSGSSPAELLLLFLDY